MTLVEYVQSLQEQGATDIPDKVQEWKKKNQPKVEEEVKIDPVVETKKDATVAGKNTGASKNLNSSGSKLDTSSKKPREGDVGYEFSWSNRIYTADEIEKNLLGTKNWKKGPVKLNEKGKDTIVGIPKTVEQYISYINNYTNNTITARPLTVEEQFESIDGERPDMLVTELEDINLVGESRPSKIDEALGFSVFEPSSEKANKGLEIFSNGGSTLFDGIRKDNFSEVTIGIGTEAQNNYTDVNAYARGTIDFDKKNLFTDRNILTRNITSTFGNYQGVPLSQIENNNIWAFDVKERELTENNIKNRIATIEIELSQSNDVKNISNLENELSTLKEKLADEFGNLNTVNIPNAIKYRVVTQGQIAQKEFLDKSNKPKVLKEILEQGLNHIGTVEQDLVALEKELESLPSGSGPESKAIRERIKQIEARTDFGEKLYDKNTGKMVAFDKAPIKVIETQEKAEDLAEVTELNVLENNLLNRNFELVGIAKDFLKIREENKSKINIGQTPVDKLFGPGREKKDLALINYIVKNGKLPEDIYNLSGDSLVAETFNDALDNYEVINKAILINRNPLTAKRKNYIEEAVDATANIVGLDITTKQEGQMQFIEVLRRDGTFNEKELKNFESLLKLNTGQNILRGVPTLFEFGVEIALTRKLTGNKIGKVFKYLDDIAVKYFKGNKYMKTAINAITKGLTEGSEFAAATVLKNMAFDESESAGDSFAQGGAMGFGGTFGKAFFGAINKTMLKANTYSTLNYYLDKSEVYKNFIASAQSAAGGATAYISGGILMGNQNLEYEKLTETFVEEWSKMFILGKLQKGLRDPGGSMRASYRRMSNDLLRFSNLSYNSKKGAGVLEIDTKIISNPTETSNEQVASAAQAKIDAIAKDAKDGKITTKKSLELIKQIAQAKMSVLNQIGINQAKVEIKKERAKGQAPTVAEEYRTLNKVKAGEKLNAKDSKTLAELPPELILEKMGAEATTDNLRIANEMIDRESKIQDLLNGGSGIIVTQAGFEAFRVKEGEYKALPEKLREETYEFLNKKFALNDALTTLKNMKTSNMSVLEKESYEEAVKEQEAELSKLQKGGTTYDLLQGKLQKDALTRYEADVVKAKELAKTNVKGEVVESLSKIEFQKAYDASGLIPKNVKESPGFINPNTGDRFINREKALEVKNFNVGNHEGIHAVTLDVFKGSDGKVTKEGIVVIDNILSSLSSKQRKILNKELESRYDTSKDKSEYYEENLTVLSELIRDNIITFNKSIGEKLLDMVPLYKKNGFKNLEINAKTGEGIFDMLRGLAKDEVGAVDAASEFAKKAAEDKTIETKSDIAPESKAKITEENLKTSKENLKVEEEIIKIGAFKVSELEGENRTRIVKKLTDLNLGLVKNLASKAANNPKIASLEKGKRKTYDDFLQGYSEQLTKIINNYEPIVMSGKNAGKRVPFGAYLADRLKLRYGNVLTDLKKGEVKATSIDTKEAKEIADTPSVSKAKEVNTDVKLVDNIKINKQPLSTEFKDKVRGFVTEQLEGLDSKSEQFRKQAFKPSKAFVDLIVKEIIGNPKKFREFLNENPTFYKGLNISELIAIDEGRVKTGKPRLFTELNRRLTKIQDIEKFMMQGRVPYLTVDQMGQGANLYNRLTPKVSAVINNFFGGTPQNNSNKKRAIAKAIANKFIAEATPSTEAFKAKTPADKAIVAERLQVSQEAKFAKAKVMDSKKEIIIKEGYIPVERGKAGVDRTREFVLGAASDIFGVEIVTAIIATNKVLSTAGNTAYGSRPKADGTPKPGSGAVGGGYNFISNALKLLSDYGPNSKNPNPKTVKDTLALIEAGELGDLAVLQKELSATKKEGIYNAKDIAAIKRFINHKNLKDGGIENNTKDMAEINRGKKLMLDGFRKIYEADKNTLPLIAEVSYSFNSNKNPFRDLATLVGGMEGLKKGVKTWEEHMMQFGMYTNEMLKAIKGSAKGWNSFVDWSNNNYYQLKLSKEAANLIDQNFKGIEGLEDWNAKSQFHKLQIESFKLAEKTGDYSKVIDPMIRAYNEYVTLNPFSITRLGVTDAKRYLDNVEISKVNQKNLNVQIEAANLINKVIRSEAGFLKVGDTDFLTRKEAKKQLLASENLAKGQEAAAKLGNEIMIPEIKYNKPIPVKKAIDALAKTDKASDFGRKLDPVIKKARVFDFDDTLAKTKSNVLYTMPDGRTGKLTATEFALKAGDLERQGVVFDFSEFSKVMDGKKGPLFELAKIMNESPGKRDMFVLTARPQDAAGPIKEFLESLGLNIPIENITGLSDGTPQAKAGWIMGKAAEGFNDFYFADDAMKNVKAVKNVLDVLDVKGTVQQAKFSKAKTYDIIINDMIKESSGIETYKEYSAARAKTVGASKGRFNFFIPASAEDFTGLLYKMLGKGKKGDAQMAFLKTNLLDTYDRAESAVTQAKIAAANDFKALKSNLKTLPSSLSKSTGIGGFTFSHAVRVAAWTAQGMEIPGLSKRDVKELNDFVNNNAELKVFTNELLKIQKGKLYPKPGKNWLGGNITSDIINDINKVNREDYQQEFRENVDIIFSEANMNKMEAAYGTRWREAMEDSLRRMKSGSNRPPGGNRITDGILDWLNNSVGAVMFLNTRSALLQTISAVNFVNWGDNNIVKAGAAFANQKQYWKDYMKLMNSDYLVERRNGLKINVSESEIADAVKDSNNKPKAAIAFLLSKGFVMTRIADSFAIAAGGATFYRNRVKSLLEKGMEQEAAEAQAFEDFRQIAEESQQSSNPNRISAQQASAAGRVVLAWANTPMQYARIQKRAGQDLINNRGDWKTNVSKIVYYGAIQNLIFNSLQQAVFALAFGEDEDEEEQAAKKSNKISRVANGMIDSQLKGLGIGGAAVVALKSTLMELGKQHAKDRPAYEEAVFDLLGFSPPLGSKVQKINGGLRSFSWNMKDIQEKGYSLDNPAYLAGAQITTGLTNVPLDRVVKKMNSMRGIVNEQSALWQKVALGLGWSTWDVGLGYYGGFDAAKVLTPKEEKVKEIDDMKKLTKTKEQVDMLLDLGLTKKEIKALGKEQARVEKIIELQNAEAKPKEEAEVKEEIKEETKPKPKITAESRLRRQFDSIKDENKPEQVKSLLGFGLSKKEVRALKYEKDRVEKILELMKKNKNK